MTDDTFGDDAVGPDDADRVEEDLQADEESSELPGELPIEANEADVIDQARPIPESEEDYPGV